MMWSTFWYQSSLISRGRLLLILDSSSSALPLRARFGRFFPINMFTIVDDFTAELNSRPTPACLYSRNLFTIPNPAPLQISSVLSDPLTVTSLTPTPINADTISTNRTSSLTMPSKIPFFAISVIHWIF
jgi:hypothetical protein